MPRKPLSWYRAMWRSITNGLPGRFYSSDLKIGADSTLRFYVHTSPEIQAEKEKAEGQGKKLRIFIPKVGIPISFGSDLIEKIEAVDKKIDRRLRAEYY